MSAVKKLQSLTSILSIERFTSHFKLLLRDADWDQHDWRFQKKTSKGQINSYEHVKILALPPISHSTPSHLIPSHPHPPSLPLSHPNRWDLQKNQFPLPSGEAQCFTTVSDWWRADAISHPAAFYSSSELVAIQRIFMANNNRRCNSYSPRWVNLSRETRGWPAQTAGGQSHVNKLLRLNDWVHGCEGLGQFNNQTWRLFLRSLASNLSFQFLKVTTMSWTLILQSGRLLTWGLLYQVHLSTPHHLTACYCTVKHASKLLFDHTWTRSVIEVRARGLILLLRQSPSWDFHTSSRKWCEEKKSNAYTGSSVRHDRGRAETCSRQQEGRTYSNNISGTQRDICK